jgi:hypothetical protein
VRKAFPDCQRLDDWKILSGSALNTTYKIQMGKEAIVLRLYARNRLHCKAEKEIHRLIDRRVSTPKLLYVDESYQPLRRLLQTQLKTMGVHVYQRCS